MLRLTSFLYIIILTLTSCGMGGSYPYAESIYSDCKRNELIHNLTKLKKTGSFTRLRDFTDGARDASDPFYYFYFSSDEINGTILLSVNSGIEKKHAIYLIAFLNYNDGVKWQKFNHGLGETEHAKIMNWFEKNILPTVTCN